MRPGLRDQREEIKGILKYTEEHGLNSTSEGEDEVMPMNLCRKLSPVLEWKLLTGFNYDTLQKVVERAPHLYCLATPVQLRTTNV